MPTKFLWLSVFLIGCGGDTSGKPSGGSGTGSSGSEAKVSLAGAGATFPQPLFEKWFAEFSQSNAAIRTDYQGIGSGAGITQLTNETVDFAASDDGMTDAQIAKVARGVRMLPIAAGVVVLGYNVPDVAEPIKLSRKAYVGMFLGKIKQWDDAEVAKSNPGVKLPALAVAVVHRAESSGTTAVFTQHLSAISNDWKSGPGAGKSVKWPVGSGAKGNDQVIAQVKQTPGAIGYVEFGYAKFANVRMAVLENKAGKFVAPSTDSGVAALSEIKLSSKLMGFVPDPVGEGCYPIATFTYLLLYKSYPDASKAQAVEKLVRYCLTTGQTTSDKFGYLPLPEQVAKQAAASLDSAEAKAAP